MTIKKNINKNGFTLMELLITLALSAIVFGVVAPSAKRIIDKHRISADINHASALIRFARTMAISQVETVKLCPSWDYSECGESWDKPFIIFTDRNNNNIRDNDEELMASGTAIAKQHKITGPRSPIKFYENGTHATPASLTLCPKSNDNTLARAIYISLQGRTRLSIDHNNDGIHERIEDTNLQCELM